MSNMQEIPIGFIEVNKSSDVSSERGQPSPQNEVIFGVSEKQLNFLSSKDISVKHGKVNKSM